MDASDVDDLDKKLNDTHSGTNIDATWLTSPYSPNIPLIHSNVVATPGNIPGINNRQRA